MELVNSVFFSPSVDYNMFLHPLLRNAKQQNLFHKYVLNENLFQILYPVQ